jgi:hypothetical protein
MNMDILYRNRLWFVKHKNAKCHAFPAVSHLQTFRNLLQLLKG